MVLHAELTGFAALSALVARDGEGAVGAEELGVAVNRCLEPLRAFSVACTSYVCLFGVSTMKMLHCLVQMSCEMR